MYSDFSFFHLDDWIMTIICQLSRRSFMLYFVVYNDHWQQTVTVLFHIYSSYICAWTALLLLISRRLGCSVRKWQSTKFAPLPYPQYSFIMSTHWLWEEHTAIRLSYSPVSIIQISLIRPMEFTLGANITKTNPYVRIWHSFDHSWQGSYLQINNKQIWEREYQQKQKFRKKRCWNHWDVKALCFKFWWNDFLRC